MSVENTSDRSPLEHLLRLLLRRDNNEPTDRYIQDMEAQGRQGLLSSDVLPVKVGTFESDDDYEALGFAFEPPSAGDPIFRPARLPEGWSWVPGEDSRVMYLVDGEGRRRVEVFYKAAFYDRAAFMHMR